LDVLELWKARREGRFTLKHWIWAWIISARPIALPWVILYTLFGALLAGVEDSISCFGAALTVAFILTAGHFNNNYMDVLLGIDRYVNSPGEAEKICSRLKPYTAAAWLVPLRITSMRFQMFNEVAFLFLALATYMFTVNPLKHPLTLPFFVLGVFLALSYTVWWKRWRLGEVAAFLGHGFSTVTFGYLSQSPNIMVAVLAGVPTGLLSGLAYSVDQFVDIRTDFVRRVRAVYESWFNSKMPLGLYVIVVFVFWLNVVLAWVVAGIYPKGVLLVLAVIPLILFKAPALQYDRDRALRDLALTATWLIPALMCLGATI